MSVEQVTQGVAGIQVSGRRKKPARAYHDLNAGFQQAQPQRYLDQINNGQPQFGYPNPVQQSPAVQQAAHLAQQATGFPQQQQPQQQFNQFQQAPFQQPQQPIQQQTAVDFSSTVGGDSLSVPFTRRADENEWKYRTFKTFEDTMPPTSTTTYQAFDQSSSAPIFTRLSLYQIPATEQLRAQTKLPLGLTVRPFAPTEEPVPVIDTSETNGPLRCHRCRAYLNPFMQFKHDGSFKCNLCKFSNRCPQEYYSPIGPDGRRQDFLHRPELFKGTVDYLVPKEYWEGPEQAQPLHFLFVVDVSASNEIISASVESIKSSLFSLPSGCKVGIVTYDQKLQFYKLASDIPSVHIVSDIEEPFVPLFSGFFVDPREYDVQINATLMKISELYNQFKSPTIAYGAVIKVAGMALKEVGGGKIIANISKTPSCGPGFLSNTNNADKGNPLTFKPSNEFYINLAKDLLQSNVSVDLFILSQSSIDLKNSGLPVFRTGGTLKLYPNFNLEKDELTYIQDVIQSITTTRGYQGQLKTRCSNGLQIQNYYGNFDSGPQDPKFPVLTSEQEIASLFKYDGKLTLNEDFSFQTAVLYTDHEGIRKVRVINNVAAVTSEVSNIFSFADQDTVLNIFIKNCLAHLTTQHSTAIKNSLKDKLIEIFTQYRSIVSNTNPTQLVLPDSLTSLTAYISSFQKSKVFKTDMNNNLKMYEYHQLNALPLNKLLLHLYPRFIELHNLQDSDCETDEYGKFNMPFNIRASGEFIQTGGCYMIFNGEKLFIYVHQHVNPLLLKDLFDVESIQELSPALNFLPNLQTEISQKAQKLVAHFREELKFNELPVILIRQGIDHMEFLFAELLVEDRAMDKTPSFNELLQVVHKSIKENLQNGKAGGSASSNASSFMNRGSSMDEAMAQSFVHF